MLNRVELIGHLGADPEIRRTQDGRPIANLSLATGEKWTDRNTGETTSMSTRKNAVTANMTIIAHEARASWSWRRNLTATAAV